MRAADLGSARVAIWGLGREGLAAVQFLRARHPNLPLLLLDDAKDVQPSWGNVNLNYGFGSAAIIRALGEIDVLIKSPGVSLYRPEIAVARDNKVAITSLMNLWFAEGFGVTTICVTGSKGKSTTASLISHILRRLGRKVALAGNIGVPITEIDESEADYAVIEVSSYQAADFDAVCDVAVLTSLFPEHLDWHHTLDAYYNDKLNLLRHSSCPIINRLAMSGIGLTGRLFNDDAGVHAHGTEIFDGVDRIAKVRNRYLARPHNLSNVCAALTVAKVLDLGLAEALDVTGDFMPLPHRQQEVGTLAGILYVDDSISTAPESTIAALDVYSGQAITVIVGGHDRGVDYDSLIAKLASGGAQAVVCLGASGGRIYTGLTTAARGDLGVAMARSMQDAVARAKEMTPGGGVVLLSPAAPSYGDYRDFAERGRDFVAKAGFVASNKPPA